MKSILYALIPLFLLTQCAPVNVAVSDELKGGDQYAVSGRQGILIKQKLSFGGYATDAVKRSWTKGRSSWRGFRWTDRQGAWVNVISTEYINKKQTFNFHLNDGKNHSEVFAASKFRAEDLQVGRRENSPLNIALELGGIGHSSSNLFYLQVFLNDEEDPWQLVLDNQEAQARPKKYTGVIAKSRDEYYTLVPITRMEIKGKAGGILAGSLGYELLDPSGRAVAAVSMIDKGKVYLARGDAKERFLLANICAALLLQQNIGE